MPTSLDIENVLESFWQPSLFTPHTNELLVPPDVQGVIAISEFVFSIRLNVISTSICPDSRRSSHTFQAKGCARSAAPCVIHTASSCHNATPVTQSICKTK